MSIRFVDFSLDQHASTGFLGDCIVCRSVCCFRYVNCVTTLLSRGSSYDYCNPLLNVSDQFFLSLDESEAKKNANGKK